MDFFVNKTSVAEHQEKLARTSGDGMEQEPIQSKESTKDSVKVPVPSNKSAAKLDHENRPQQTNRNVCHTIIKSNRLINIDPKLKSKERVQYILPKPTKSNRAEGNVNDRKPKFVPMEPYQCAIKPIVPSLRKKPTRRNKNNLDISILVSQMSHLKTNELEDAPVEEKSEEKTAAELEREKFCTEIEDLKMQRDHIQSQLKFQVQVNSELKNLLVAAVGEDLQTKVNVLTEDKLQLARALLDTANNLSTHTEQIEFLAGQCEVWRSKFLATSVMVEELARWKADLSHKNALLSKSNRQMLQLTSELRDMQINVLKNLKFLAKLKQLNLISEDLVGITSECLNISEQMVLHSGIGGMPPDSLMFRNSPCLTDAEKGAVQALECMSQPLMSTDEAFKAIVSQAFNSKIKESLLTNTGEDSPNDNV